MIGPTVTKALIDLNTVMGKNVVLITTSTAVNCTSMYHSLPLVLGVSRSFEACALLYHAGEFSSVQSGSVVFVRFCSVCSVLFRSFGSVPCV